MNRTAAGPSPPDRSAAAPQWLPAPLNSGAERVLLVSPPVYDTRLHWADWQQPAILLRLSTVLRARDADVRLLNALELERGKRLRRRRVDTVTLDGQDVVRWRHGSPEQAIGRALAGLQEEGWYPDIAVVECFTTFWWEGAAESIRSVRASFPHVRIALVGPYAALAPEHARGYSGADDILSDPMVGLDCTPADLSRLSVPHSAHITLAGGQRPVDEVVAEIETAVSLGVKRIAYTDAITGAAADRLGEILEEVLRRGIRVRMHALGSVRPADLMDTPELANQMRRSGFAQICFADDRDAPANGAVADDLISSYRCAADLCHRAGFPTRTDCLVGAVSLGRPGEDLAERARTATLVSHAIGGVILWPYQPDPGELSPAVPLEMQNGKLFPFREYTGFTYRDYLHVLGLGVVLNAKYRDHTFDFLGDSMIARLFRDSIARESWMPDASIKGTLHLPVLRR